MIRRYMYTGYSNGVIALKNNEKYSNASLFSFRGQVFLYFESEAEHVCPMELADDGLIPFPDGRLWIRMMDIFHYAEPQSSEHWRRKNSDVRRKLMINKLEPDMVSSYIFHHFQLQEERPRPYKFKYGIIFILEDTIVMYMEEPNTNDELDYPGKLETQNSPSQDIWQDIMKQHFHKWPDYEKPWRPTELLCGGEIR